MTAHPFYAPDFSVRVEGLTLAADVRNAISSLTYENNTESADMFKLQLNNSDLRFTDSALFDVGKDVEIHLGYAGELVPMMLGEIVAISPAFPAGGAPTLTVTGYDKSHRMRHNSPPHKSFKYVNDGLVVAQIAAENKLVPMVDPAVRFNESIEQTGSDWALLQELADRNHYQVFVHWDKLFFRSWRPQTKSVVLEWGRNLESFTPRLSTAGQKGVQVVRSYNHELAQAIVSVLPAVALDSDLGDIVERLGSRMIDELAKLGRFVTPGKRINDHFDAAEMAKSVLLQTLEGLYEGSGKCIGIPQLRAGEIVDIRGVGKRFSGNYRLSKVKHTINQSGYHVDFEVAQSSGSDLLRSLRKKLNDSPSPNKQGAMQGLMVARVANNVDVKRQGRIQVTFPDLADDKPGPWARVATFLAGGDGRNSWGNYFLPDVGDEVIVGFPKGSIDEPVVLGSLWNGKVRPPEVNEGPNERRFLRTKSGMGVAFDEGRDSQRLKIEDAKGNHLCMLSSAKREAVTITDAAGARIELDHTPDKKGLTLTDSAGSRIHMDSTTGDIVIEAKRNVVVRSGSGGRIDLNP